MPFDPLPAESGRVLTKREQDELDVLLAARRRIDSPSKWRKDGGGGRRLCALNAVYRVRYKPTTVAQTLQMNEIRWRAIGRLTKALPTLSYGNLIGYNDHHRVRHRDIMAVFDRAITKLLQ